MHVMWFKVVAILVGAFLILGAVISKLSHVLPAGLVGVVTLALVAALGWLAYLAIKRVMRQERQSHN